MHWIIDLRSLCIVQQDWIQILLSMDLTFPLTWEQHIMMCWGFQTVIWFTLSFTFRIFVIWLTYQLGCVSLHVLVCDEQAQAEGKPGFGQNQRNLYLTSSIKAAAAVVTACPLLHWLWVFQLLNELKTQMISCLLAGQTNYTLLLIKTISC